MAQRKRTRSAGGQKARTKTATRRGNAAKKATKKLTTPRAKKPRDPRLPARGTTIVRPYKGKDIKVAVLEDGFRWEGKPYRSLSALASAITGAKSINGFFWFRLTERKERPKKPTAKSAEMAPAAESAAS